MNTQRLFLTMVALCASALRAQTFDVVQLRAVMIPEAVSPPVTTLPQTAGSFTMAVQILRGDSGEIVAGRYNYTFAANFPEEATLTAIELRMGGEGVNGPAVLSLDPDLPVTAVRFNRGINGSLDPKLAEDLIANPNAYYVEASTSANRQGALRSQVKAIESVTGLMNMQNGPVPSISGDDTGVVRVTVTRMRDTPPEQNWYDIVMIMKYHFAGKPVFGVMGVKAPPGSVVNGWYLNAASASPQTVGESRTFNATITQQHQPAALAALFNQIFDSPESFSVELYAADSPRAVPAMSAPFQRAESALWHGVMEPLSAGSQARGYQTAQLQTIRSTDGSIAAAALTVSVWLSYPSPANLTVIDFRDKDAAMRPIVLRSAAPLPISTAALFNFPNTILSGADQLLLAEGLMADPSGFGTLVHTVEEPDGSLFGGLQ